MPRILKSLFFALIIAILFLGKDGGVNWISGSPELQSSVIKVVSFDPQKTDRVYLGTNTQGIYLLLIK